MTDDAGLAAGATATAPTAPTPAKPKKPARRRKLSTGEGRLATYLIAPTLVMMAVVIGYPIIAAAVTSLKGDKSLLPNGLFSQGGNFIGFGHYTDWLLQRCAGSSCPSGLIGGQMYDAVFFTVFYTFVSVVVEIVLGMMMAIVMNKAFRGRALLRASVLVPWAIPTAVTAKLWYFMFAYDGIVNHVLGTHILWTDGKWPSISAIIIADVWKTTPFMALLILAGLQVIPADLYESAKMDGATGWQAFRRITLPLVRPALMVAVLFRILDALRVYDLPAILTHGGGGNGHATTSLSMLVIKEIQQGGYGSASALSTLVFLFIFLVAFVFVRILGVHAVQTQQRKVA